MAEWSNASILSEFPLLRFVVPVVFCPFTLHFQNESIHCASSDQVFTDNTKISCSPSLPLLSRKFALAIRHPPCAQPLSHSSRPLLYSLQCIYLSFFVLGSHHTPYFISQLLNRGEGSFLWTFCTQALLKKLRMWLATYLPRAQFCWQVLKEEKIYSQHGKFRGLIFYMCCIKKAHFKLASFLMKTCVIQPWANNN